MIDLSLPPEEWREGWFPVKPMNHIYGFEKDKALCGASIKTTFPAPCKHGLDCVVCAEMGKVLSQPLYEALCEFWGV